MHLFTNKQCVGVFTLYKGIQVLLNEKILLWVFQEYLYIGTIEGRMFILWRYFVFYFCFRCCSIQIFITTKAFNSKFFSSTPYNTNRAFLYNFCKQFYFSHFAIILHLHMQFKVFYCRKKQFLYIKSNIQSIQTGMKLCILLKC